MKSFKTKIFLSFLTLILVAFTVSPIMASLTPGESYTVILEQVNSDGTLTEKSTSSVAADANEKIDYAFTNVPTHDGDGVNFLVITVKTEAGTVLSKGLVPAPAQNTTTKLGANALSTTQTKSILEGFAANSTDDPIYASFGFVITRSPEITDADITNIALGGGAVILGTGGYVATLEELCTTAQMTAFKSALIYNATEGTSSLANYTEAFNDAVALTDTTAADNEMAKASGSIMADIFMDAAEKAGVKLEYILIAFDATGYKVEDNENMMAISTAVMNNMNAAVSSFMTRIAATKVQKKYTAALTVLEASGTQVTNFNAAVSTMVSSQEDIDTEYSGYFMDPEGYLDDHPELDATAIQTALNTAFTSIFTTFQADIESSDAEITSMRATMATAFNITVAELISSSGNPPIGRTYKMEMTAPGETPDLQNWPIPITVVHSWVANIIANGGSISYTRDTLAIPSMMQQWMSTRHDFTEGGTPASFAALMGIREDVEIIQMTKFSLYEEGGRPDQAVEKAGKEAFVTRLVATMARITGTTDGTTEISEAQKKALIALMVEPNLH
ncbi:hypothetical protein HOC37_04840 [bacterium]|nr:hypothetical protein [bacterium]MBT4552289.1 hypothetical protein [bacterium]